VRQLRIGGFHAEGPRRRGQNNPVHFGCSKFLAMKYIDSLKFRDKFLAFRVFVESIGGDISSMRSPLDPIFWLHHCNLSPT
jgi:hypothetical protein